MKIASLAVLLVFFMSFPVLAADGLINIQSAFCVEETADRLVEILNEKGMTVFNRIKHSDAAAMVGVELRDTELVLFGNPKVGSPLIKCRQSVAIDLPQKALIWTDSASTTWLSYNDPRYLEQRHDISGCEQVILKIEQALAVIAKAATTK